MKMAALVFNSMSVLRDLFSLLKPRPRKTKYDLPLPPKVHVKISDKEIGDRPVLIIGDVHGCFDELQDLIKQAQQVVKSSNLFLVFVGDMLNKGPKNLEVMTFIRELANQKKAAAVKGNHEESLLREYRSMKQSEGYELSEKYKYLSSFSEDDFHYLQTLPYTLTIPKINSIVVHAGVVPGLSLERQSLIDLCHMRNIIFKHKIWGTEFVAVSKIDDGVAWATQWQGPQHVYFGHDARRGLQKFPHATGLDTGCVYGHNLTGVIIDSKGEKQFVSVPAKTSHYAT